MSKTEDNTVKFQKPKTINIYTPILKIGRFSIGFQIIPKKWSKNSNTYNKYKHYSNQ